jgi:5'-nucleotidase
MQMSRRKFLKTSFAVGAGAMLSLYTDGSYRIALAQTKPDFRLRILHTNDHHARVEPILDNDGEVVHAGVARRKTLIDSIRKTNGLPLLLLDAGDTFQGTLWFNLYSGLADLEFYNAMGYDAIGVGNHEFNKGQGALATFIQKARFPVVTANILTAPTSPLNGLFTPHLIVEKSGKRIGIFGLTTEDTPALSLGAREGSGVTFTPALQAAVGQVKVLREAGADYVIALTHIGVEQDRKLAETVAGINMIVGGHSHTPMGPMLDPVVTERPYPEIRRSPDGHPVVLVHDWEWGRWLGDITLSFKDGQVVDVSGNPVEVSGDIAPDPSFEARIAVLKGPIDELTRTVIGETAVLLNGERADIRTSETNLGNLIAEAVLERIAINGAQMAIMNSGGIRASIDIGPVTVGDVLTVLPFGNTIAHVDLTGTLLKEALENGVSRVEEAAGRFPQIAGFSFVFNPAAPVGSRVVSMTYNGAPIDMNATYRVATNSFMLLGGDGYTMFAKGSNGIDTGYIIADIVQEYIGANSPVNIGTDGRISEGTAAALQLRLALRERVTV